jgi:hypothetical protein
MASTALVCEYRRGRLGPLWTPRGSTRRVGYTSEPTAATSKCLPDKTSKSMHNAIWVLVCVACPPHFWQAASSRKVEERVVGKDRYTRTRGAGCRKSFWGAFCTDRTDTTSLWRAKLKLDRMINLPCLHLNGNC